MARKSQREAALSVLQRSATPLSLANIARQAGAELPQRTLRRWLSEWVADGLVECSGVGRSTRYRHISPSSDDTAPATLVFLRGLDNAMKTDLLAQIRDLWTHTSTALEGNTLTLGDTHFVLQEGLTISGKPIKDHQEVIGHARAIDLLYRSLSATRNASGEGGYVVSSAGTTAVWAPENTREGIFEGMQSKETYGTTGTLIRLRFFGGWDYPKDLVKDKDFVKKAYAGGVPMGGDLPPRKGTDLAKAPSFAVWALKDPNSGNLDRVQIIKGWSNATTGYAEEKIYDVAWSDNRKPDPKTGKLPPVGNTVDVKTATYKNSIGDNELIAVWTDPDFNPEMKAVYYVRVLEIPTPRWTTFDAKALGIEPPSDVPATIQERAWSSAIWYTPEAKLVKRQDFYPGLKPWLP